MANWSLQEVAQHNSQASCWVIIRDNVYDVTQFLPEHPGGSAIILKYAGKDATMVYEPIHPPDALDKHLPNSMHLGPVGADAASQLHEAVNNKLKTRDERRVEDALKQRPPLYRILSLADMERVARSVLSHKALAYYSTGSDDQMTHSENARAFSRFYFHPRVMRRLGHCDPSTTILGYHSSIPVFVSGAALAKLGHPQGELNITRGAGKESIIQMVSSNASVSFSSIIEAARPSQPIFFQLYKHRDDAKAAERVREAEELGYKAIFLTVDAIVAGNREGDIRSPWVLDDQERGAPAVHDENAPPDLINLGGTAGQLVSLDDRDMTWEKTIPWLRRVTKLPIVIKGIQSVQDALAAAEAGVDGILISNHGGRQLDYSMPPIEILHRLQTRHPHIFKRLEVYIDGGIYRGTDVLKALCLGATAVGLGKAFLYAQSAYGEAGVVKTIEILRREIVTGMTLLGAATVRDLKPELVERVDWESPLRAKL